MAKVQIKLHLVRKKQGKLIIILLKIMMTIIMRVMKYTIVIRLIQSIRYEKKYFVIYKHNLL